MRALIATTVFVAGLAIAAAQEPEKKQEKQPDKKLNDPPEKGPDKAPIKPPAEPDKPTATDPVALPPAIEGGYTVASGERNGRPIPKEELKDSVVRITRGRVVATDRDRVEFVVATYTLDTTKTPWILELRHFGAKDVSGGLVKKEGNVVTIVFALPGGEAPKEFKTKEKQEMFVLRGFVLDPLPPPNKFSSSP